ncbi:MAG: hypothetical protein ABJB66_08750 [Gemmatimonadaceae bacterium]
MRNSNTNQQSIEVRETSAFVGALLIALMLPAAVPLWMIGQRAVAITTMVVTVALAFLFSSIRLVVQKGYVRVLLGGVIPVKNVALDEVVDIRRVSPPKWAGLGIRLMKEGTLYTVTMGDAVEFSLRNGSKFFVGLSRPNEFCELMQPLLGSRSITSARPASASI